MSNFKFRGCCCGIPFGCGVLVLALVAMLLWKLAVPGSFWPSGAGHGLALLVIPGVVLALGAAGARRR
ncbi:MAG: hypothetical protein JF614_24265 [Acidobacteria bacterium]|nr:hypothetical protein [Acidobacteriota bacterium]